MLHSSRRELVSLHDRPHPGSDLVGELSTRSDTFRTWWGSHDVRYHRSGVKKIHHPVVGDLELAYEALELPTDPGLSFNTYTAEPNTPSADALKVLASWAATQITQSASAAATDG